MEKRHLITGEIRAIGSTIIGSIPYDSRSQDLGGFVEVLKPGAFSKSIKSKNIIALVSHDSKKPLANTARGTLKLTDTPEALNVEMRLDPSISWHNDVLQATRRGDFTGLSFGFKINTNGENWREESGVRVRELKNIDLREISPVTFPAYPSTSIAVRSKLQTTKGSNHMNKNEMRQEKVRLLTRIREISDMEENTENRSELDKLDREYERLTSEIEKADRREWLQVEELRMQQSQRPPNKPRPEQNTEQRDSESCSYATPEGRYSPEFEQRNGPEGVKIFKKFLGWGSEFLTVEQHTMYVDDFTQGGALITPVYFMKEVIKNVDDETFALTECRVIPIGEADKWAAPALGADPDDGEWTQELSAGTEDDAMAFEGRQMSAHPMAKRIKVSKDLARSEFGANFIAQRLAYKHAVALEKAWLLGDGVRKPLGVFFASGNGIDIDRDCSTGNTATSIRADNILENVYNLKSQHLRKAKWLYHRSVLKSIRKLKDGEGNWLWVPGLAAGQPDTLAGFPVITSEFAPSTMTAGSYVGILGDFSQYWWVQAYRYEMQVLVELYAAQNCNGYFGRLKMDGAPMVSEAFSRVQLAP